METFRSLVVRHDGAETRVGVRLTLPTAHFPAARRSMIFKRDGLHAMCIPCRVSSSIHYSDPRFCKVTRAGQDFGIHEVSFRRWLRQEDVDGNEESFVQIRTCSSFPVPPVSGAFRERFSFGSVPSVMIATIPQWGRSDRDAVRGIQLEYVDSSGQACEYDIRAHRSSLQSSVSALFPWIRELARVRFTRIPRALSLIGGERIGVETYS